MNCPRCGFPRPVDDRVCRRCKIVFDEDRFVSLTPPRAADRTMLDRIEQWTPRIPRWKPIRVWPWVPIAASVIPGLGHLLQRRIVKGLFFLMLVIAPALWSVAHFSEQSGQMAFGLAVSAHAACVFDTTPWRYSAFAVRGTAMASILLVLLFAYWPTVARLANQFVKPETRYGERARQPLQVLGTEQIVIMIVLFAVSIAATAFVTRRLSSRES